MRVIENGSQVFRSRVGSVLRRFWVLILMVLSPLAFVACDWSLALGALSKDLFSIEGKGFLDSVESERSGRGPKGRLSERSNLFSVCWESVEPPPTGFRLGPPTFSIGSGYIFPPKSSDDFADSGKGFRDKGFGEAAPTSDDMSFASLSRSRASSSVLRWR
jgi:hypothetical protein